MKRVLALTTSVFIGLGGCVSKTPLDAADQKERGGLFELLPHVRVDASARMVEFDGVVPIDCHHPDTPDVYLELIACSLGREHESLILSRAMPSHIHAGLLAAGATHGTPGRTGPEGYPPSGDVVHIRFRWQDEDCVTYFATPADWIRDEGYRPNDLGWMFAGSKPSSRDGSYSADRTGVLIGLSTFGDEVIALDEVFSPDLASGDRTWLAENAAVPKVNTPVVVELWLGSIPREEAQR